MKTFIKLLVIFCLFINYAQGQTDSLKQSSDTIYTKGGDTIFTNKDFKIFIGQKLLVGKGSGKDGWYNTISDHSLIDVYSLTLGVLGSTSTETTEEKDLRINNTLIANLKNENILYIKKINKHGNKRHGYMYTATLRYKSGLTHAKYFCFLIEAIRKGELIIPKEQTTP